MSSTHVTAVRRGHVVRAAAVAALAVGYLDLSRGGITIGAALLVVGYVVLVPLAILSD